MQVTIVAPRKDLTEEHRNNLQRLQRERLAGFPYVTGHYEHYDPDLWSFSRAVNVGRAQVDTPGLVITPADYLLDPDVVAAAAALLDEWPWAQVYQRTIVLPEDVTGTLLAGGQIPTTGMVCHVLAACMACTAVRADVFDDVGGMDPRFRGWGPEDASFRMKLEMLHGPPAPPPGGYVAEMWSPGMGEWRGAVYHGHTPNRAANVELWQRYATAGPVTMRAMAEEAKAAMQD